MNKKTTTILAAIRKACPELMELSFGCELESVDGVHARILDTNGINYFKVGIMEDDLFIATYSKLDETLKVIGHPPHIGHLLRTIGNEHIMVDCYGDLILSEFCQDDNLHELFRSYEEENLDNMQLDTAADLTQQLETNQELREFVYQLVK